MLYEIYKRQFKSQNKHIFKKREIYNKICSSVESVFEQNLDVRLGFYKIVLLSKALIMGRKGLNIVVELPAKGGAQQLLYLLFIPLYTIRPGAVIGV